MNQIERGARCRQEGESLTQIRYEAFVSTRFYWKGGRHWEATEKGRTPGLGAAGAAARGSAHASAGAGSGKSEVAAATGVQAHSASLSRCA